MKHFVISIDIFDVDVSVMLDFNETGIRRHFRKEKQIYGICQAMKGWDESNEKGRAFCLDSPIVLLRSKGVPAHKMAAVITHEMMHIGFEILRGLGIKHSEETEEVYCYLTDYLVGETFRRMRGRP